MAEQYDNALRLNVNKSARDALSSAIIFMFVTHDKQQIIDILNMEIEDLKNTHYE